MNATLLDKLLADIKTAMKERDSDTLTSLRTLHAAVKDATVNAGRDADDAAVAAVVARQIKQLTDGASQFSAAGRTDLAGKAEREAALYRRYQPEQLDAAAVETIVREVMAETGAVAKKDMGRVMQAVMARTKGRADGRAVSQIVGRLLA